MTRLVLDASVLLSAVVSAPSSPPSILFAAARTAAFEPVACPLLLDEVRRGLAKPYFSSRVPASSAASIIEAYALLSTVLPDPERPRAVLRDPEDDYLVALAGISGSVAIVSGDRDLLDHAGLVPPALTAREACALLGLP